MPQLEFSTYLGQIFWVLVTFISFWLIMDCFIIPKISDTIDARKRKYDDFILKAEEINKKALVSLRNYEETLTAAKARAAEQIKQNESELKEMIAEKEKEINLLLKEKIAANEAGLEREKGETLKKIEELSQTAALAIVQQLGLKSISEKDIRQIPKEKGKAI